MNCPKCNTSLPAHIRLCPACGTDGGSPNVRIAKKKEEQSALELRYKDAQISSVARKCEEVLNKFQSEIKTSRAILCRNLELVHRIVKSDNELYINFHAEVESGIRLPEDNIWDQGRPAVDQTFFPNFAQHINFAALSLNDKGVEAFGDYHIILKNEFIDERSSVFEENSYLFVKKHKVIVGEAPPPGYRATWEERYKLAAAKLHSKLEQDFTEKDFPKIVLFSDGNPDNDDFIEVHIFGPIKRQAIKKVVGPKARASERALVKSIRTNLKNIGATFEEI